MAEDFIVTPWEVRGNVDYEKLVKQFGTQHLTDALLDKLKKHAKGDLHYLLRRKIFFSHRDLEWVLNEWDKGNKFYLYTGRAPSGHTHIGHLIPWLLTKWFQDKFDVPLYFQMSDDEKFYFKEELTLEDTSRLTRENMLDIIAIGFNPKKTHFLINTQHADLMYKEAAKVAKNLTISTAKAVFGLNDSNNVGEYFYTCMQSVPAFLPSVLKGKNMPCLIPYAIDQDPHFRVARDILPKLGFYKPAAIHCKFLPALTGPDSKMSASEEHTAVYTTDSAETVAKKINKYAFSGGRDTVEEHRKMGGNPDIDVSYQWMTYLEEDDKKVAKIYNEYKSGKLLTGELKQMLIEKLQKFLKEHQKNREKAKKTVDKFIFKS